MKIPRSLYREILGDAWDLLPEPIRSMHDRIEDLEVDGIARVERGAGWLSVLVASAFGFPKTSDNVAVNVSFQSRRDGELWRRTFDGKSFSSFQSCGKGRSAGLLYERFGPFAFDMALLVDEGKLEFVICGWSFLGMPLPAVWAPTSISYEFAKDGRFHFHVEIAHPLTGLLVRYRGWLMPPARA